jgi:hypothetical protein
MATNVEQITYNATDGATFGRASTEKISFYGVTPVVLNTTSTGVVVTTIGAAIPAQTASASGFGASTAAIMTSTFAQVSALMVDIADAQDAINIIRKNLVDLGLLLGS